MGQQLNFARTALSVWVYGHPCSGKNHQKCVACISILFRNKGITGLISAILKGVFIHTGLFLVTGRKTVE